MKTTSFILLLISLNFSNLSAQQTDYSEFLENALNAVYNNDKRNFIINLQYFKIALEKDNITPGTLSTNHHNMYVKCLFEALKNEMPIPEDLAQTAVHFLNYDVENNPYNMYALGRLYSFGHGVPKNYTKAILWYEQSALKGNSYGMNALGVIYLEGEGVKRNIETAKKWFENSAALGNPLAMYNLGMGYLTGEFSEDNKRDSEKAIFWLEKAGEAEHASSMISLGGIYKAGTIVQADPNKGHYWYNRAYKYHKKEAEKGNLNSMNWLAYLYENGFGIEKNEQKALYWYKLAAEKNFTDAKKNLGNYYFNKGQYSDAINWYKKASEDGNGFSMHRLGNMYENGNGVNVDIIQAAIWYEKSINANYPIAYSSIGALYKNSGQIEKARYWYKKACEKGYENGCRYLQDL